MISSEGWNSCRSWRVRMTSESREFGSEDCCSLRLTLRLRNSMWRKKTTGPWKSSSSSTNSTSPPTNSPPTTRASSSMTCAWRAPVTTKRVRGSSWLKHCRQPYPTLTLSGSTAVKWLTRRLRVSISRSLFTSTSRGRTCCAVWGSPHMALHPISGTSGAWQYSPGHSTEQILYEINWLLTSNITAITTIITCWGVTQTPSWTLLWNSPPSPSLCISSSLRWSPFPTSSSCSQASCLSL